MAASGNRPFLKRGLDEELGIGRKKLKIDEAELLCKNKVIKLGEVEVGSLAIKNINQGSMEAEREGTVLRF